MFHNDDVQRMVFLIGMAKPNFCALGSEKLGFEELQLNASALCFHSIDLSTLPLT